MKQMKIPQISAQLQGVLESCGNYLSLPVPFLITESKLSDWRCDLSYFQENKSHIFSSKISQLPIAMQATYFTSY